MSHRRTTILLLLLVLCFLLVLVIAPVVTSLGWFYSAVDEVAGPPPGEEGPDPGSAPSPDEEPALRGGDEAGAAAPSAAEGGERDRVPGFFPKLEGRVVDVVTREPIEGAQVVYAGLSASGVSWWGTSTARDGRFEIEAGEDYDPTGEWFEVRVVAAGYVTWRGNPVAAELSIEIGRAGQPARPGRIRGRAVDAEGVPLTGVLDVVLLDEVFSSMHQCALADEGGGFVLEGVAPGPREIFLEWGGRWESVYVPEGGEATVELASRNRAADRSKRGWTAEQGRALGAAYESMNKIVLRLNRERDEKLRARLERQQAELAEVIGHLDRQQDAAISTRSVVVRGLPQSSSGIVTARLRSRNWVREVREGAVEFAALGAGSWRMAYVGPDGKKTEWKLKVPAGEDAFEATFPGR